MGGTPLAVMLGDFLVETFNEYGILPYRKHFTWHVILLKVYEINSMSFVSDVLEFICKQFQFNFLSFLSTESLDSFFIDVSNNSDVRPAVQCAFEPVKFAASETRVYNCPCEMFGRYVRIRYAGDRRVYFQLCEVQVQSGGK